MLPKDVQPTPAQKSHACPFAQERNMSGKNEARGTQGRGACGLNHMACLDSGWVLAV